jgi:hypothetical protein
MTHPPESERIFVRLLNEGTDVWRPTVGRPIGAGTFEVLPTADYDVQSEEWEFVPGTLVLCRWHRFSDGPALAAMRPAPVKDREESTGLSEEIARRAGVGVTARGGLRLVATSDADAFVAACERSGFTIWGIEAYREDAGDLVRVWVPGRFFTDSEYRYSVPCQPGRMEPAHAFLRAARPSAVWFDFLVSDPRAKSYRYGCPSGHLPPPPTANPRLRLVESAEVCALREALDSRRYGGDVHVAAIRDDGMVEDPRKLLRDLAAMALGEKLEPFIGVEPIGRVWRPIPRSEATSFLVRVIAHDLAHEDRDMDDATALQIADQFLDLFAADAQFHTIHDISAKGFPGSGFHLTDATMEATVGASDKRHVGILMVFGDD